MLNIGSMMKLEIDLLHTCPVGCWNCDRLCNIPRNTVSAKGTSLADVQRLISESKELAWLWSEIHVVGGEPALHPEVKDILDELSHYKKRHNKHVDIWCLTTGTVGDLHRICPSNIALRYKNTYSKVEAKVPITISPEDLAVYEPLLNECGMPASIGICYYAGRYYPCGPGSAIAEAFGLNVGIQSLKDVTRNALSEVANQSTCRHCGLYLFQRLKIAGPKIDFQPISTSWKKALGRHGPEK